MHVFQLCVLFQLLAVSFQNENPDVHLTTPEIISRHGYPAETHTIQTTDGYLLNIHRIPNKKPSKSNEPASVIYLQHGFLSSSADWILAGPKQSLGFILADLGFDVWMGNSRGNTYSKAHVSLPPSSKEFWQFSWDEMVQYDLPATIDYIVNVTNQQKMTYVGHSMGTTLFFALMSANPKYNDRFHVMVALAPVVSVKYIRSPLRLLSPWVGELQFLVKLLGEGEFLPESKLVAVLAEYLCGHGGYGKDICENLMFIFAGYDKDQLTDEILPVIVSHAPAGSSTLTAIQFAQQIHSGRFCRFDYGEKINLLKYKTSLPPLYNPKAVQVPVAIFHADNDLFVSEEDLKILTTRLPNITDTYQVPYKDFNHIDFVYGKDAPKLVYTEVLRVIKKFTTSQKHHTA